MSWIKESGFV